MSDQALLGSVIRVDVCTRKAERGVPCLRSACIFCPKTSNLLLGSCGSALCRRVGTADIGQLVVDSVADDVGIQSLLLAFVHQRVDGLEGEFCV